MLVFALSAAQEYTIVSLFIWGVFFPMLVTGLIGHRARRRGARADGERGIAQQPPARLRRRLIGAAPKRR